MTLRPLAAAALLMSATLLPAAMAATAPDATPAPKAQAAPPAHAAAHWSYEGETGPSHWARLQKEYSTCGTGHAQSPIDIHTKNVGHSALGPIAFSYQPSALKIVDNGHTIQVNVAPGNSIAIGGKTYELKQFHFHHPSEERIDGKPYELVAHMVHAAADGSLAVVAVLFNQGEENPQIQALWNKLPAGAGQEVALPDAGFNPANLLPAKHSYYNFSGSLTTPPCSEGVNWFVLNTPVEASRVQFARFGATYPMNARATQPLHARHVDLGDE